MAVLMVVFLMVGFTMATELSPLEKAGLDMPDLKGSGEKYSDCDAPNVQPQNCYYITSDNRMQILLEDNEGVWWADYTEKMYELSKRDGKVRGVGRTNATTGRTIANIATMGAVAPTSSAPRAVVPGQQANVQTAYPAQNAQIMGYVQGPGGELLPVFSANANGNNVAQQKQGMSKAQKAGIITGVIGAGTAIGSAWVPNDKGRQALQLGGAGATALGTIISLSGK